uniref:Uncharacterized protein n=2 Tax=Brassica campestris TaxID=3711 RepID=A0A3P5ZTR8_BRACM|nr:unnamed protein product [Brassica rapa]
MTQTNAGAGTGAAAPTEPPQSNEMVLHTGSLSFSSHMSKEDEEMTRSALSAFKAKEDEIDKRRMEVRERIQAQLGRVEEETRRLSTIREELESMADPMRKEVSMVRKKIDSVNKELKPLGSTVQKKEREYKEALDTFNEKNREKVQLITKLMEMEQLVGESEKLRMKKLEELSKSIETVLTDSSLLIRFNDSNSLDELTELMDSSSSYDQNDKMCDDEIQGEETSEPCLARKRRKETERSSYALSPKPRKLVAHRVNVWEFFTQKEDDPTQNNCCLCEFLEADESST